MGLVRIERSGTRCISLDQIKKNERIQHEEEDELLLLWIEAAEDLVEARLNRAIMRQTLQLDTESISPQISLPRVGADGSVSITSLFVHSRGGEREVEVDAIRVHFVDMLPRLVIPGVDRRSAGSIGVVYEVGARDPADVPAAIRQSVLLVASHWYRSREAVSTDSRMRTSESPLPFGAEALISAFRIPNVNMPEN